MKILSAILLFYQFSCYAQEGAKRNICIRLIDSEFHESIAEVNVHIVGNTGLTDTIKSDNNGVVNYAIDTLIRYKIWSYKDGFIGMATEVPQAIKVDTLTILLKYTAGCTAYRLPEFRYKKNSFKAKNAKMLYEIPNPNDWNDNFVYEIMGNSSLDEDSLLALKRAQSVKKVLIRKGIPKSRLIIKAAPAKYPNFSIRESFSYLGKDYLFKEGTSVTASEYNIYDQEKRELIDSLMRRTLMRIVRK